MADNKKYYYMRLKENFFESEELVMLESLPDGILYSNILIKLYLKSLKNEGRLMFKDTIPYNAQMIATITRHQVGTVEKALTIFKDLGLIEVLDNGAIYMNDIQLFIGKASTEAERKKKARMAIEKEKTLIGQTSDKCPNENGQMSDELPPETEIETEIELEKETKTEKEVLVGLSSGQSPLIDMNFLLIQDTFRKSIREPKPQDLIKMNEALEFYEPKLILEAIKAAVGKGKTFSYVLGILDNWRNEDGIRSYNDWQVKMNAKHQQSPRGDFARNESTIPQDIRDKLNNFSSR
ncbi:hypothetical protein C1N55_13630 [Lysinibacillus sp. SGAir0095]|nr:phage replisome organizer N-terminal domain-containing protein [Lysinibacillus sp. SGAir0095]QCR33157.1 hypothetical protein C1N55_13630 [Lysinibacillus sp. SGAir0095]